MDPRIEWLRDVVCLELNLERSAFERLLKADSSQVHDQLTSFLQNSLSAPVVLFYAVSQSPGVAMASHGQEGYSDLDGDSKRVFFIHTSDQPIALPADLGEEGLEGFMSHVLDFGVLNKSTLESLENHLNAYFVPALQVGTDEQTESAAVNDETIDPRAEMRPTAQKLSAHLNT
ncbi:hypothetical protein KIPB_004020, partial [Kipferlia bialata]|eukprot:g4020.t1